VHSFFLAMTLFPAAQKSAQAEIDGVLGAGNLPTLADRSRLPYVDALVSEVLRWGVVVPQGLPHRLREDDVHRGHLIPKGTIVVANIHGFMHDAAVYGPDPDAFRPERFLGEGAQPDPRAHVFGFGRRVCPGAALADQELWLACASVLSTLSVTRAVGPDGTVVVPKAEWAGQLIVQPKDFVCDVKPRSKEAEELLSMVPEAKSENADDCARRIAAARGQATA
jgi:cytochrome P450